MRRRTWPATANPSSRLAAASWIQWEVARRLFAASDLNVDQMLAIAGTRNFKARNLPVRFKAHIESRVRQFKSYNVVGLEPDPRPVSGHNIYNGAVDNATGCGILLELARVFGAPSARPPHPVLFVSV